MLAVTNALSPFRLATTGLAALFVMAALGAALLSLPAWVWPTAAGAAALGIAIRLAEARRSGLPHLPAIRHIAGE
jgi:hypothetical protein